jgi:hypothetical protein
LGFLFEVGCCFGFLGEGDHQPKKKKKMPGVLIDEHHPFGLENLGNNNGCGGSIYDFVGYSCSPLTQHNHHHHQSAAAAQHTMRRLNTFSAGMKDSEVLAASSLGLPQQQSAPSPHHHMYQRSHSFGNTANLHAFNNFFIGGSSPPNSPAKSDLGLSLLDGMDDGFFEGSEGGKSGGGSGRSDLRSLSFGGSSMSGSGSSSSLVGSPTFPDSLHSFNKFLPSNNEDEEAWPAVDMYGCDQFRMFEFKVRRCMRGRSHDWTECPFAHPGEKARRRDPRRFHYSGTACPDFRKGSCRRGDACEYAHGVFECWLHPARYRTQPCKDGRNCRRRVCFFAHTPEQLRLLPAAAQAATAAARSSSGGLSGSQAAASAAALNACLSQAYDGSPGRGGGAYDGAFVYEGGASSSSFDGGSSSPSAHAGSPLNHYNGISSSAAAAAALAGHSCVPSQMSSPTSTLVGHAHSPPPLSPPLSPSGSPPHSPSSPHGCWPSLSSPSFSSLSAASQAAMTQVLTQASLQASLSQASLARSQSSQAMGVGLGTGGGATGASSGAHPRSPPTPAHRRHLDRLNSMPTLSIPCGDHRSLQQQAAGLPGSAPVSPAGGGSLGHHQSSNKSMLELIATLQQLELRGGGGSSTPPSSNSTAQWLQQQYSSGPSPLRRCSLSVPGTPTKLQWEQAPAAPAKGRWEVDENEEGEPTVQRVESGRDLRATIYGRLGKDRPLEVVANGDDPDLGWVNELVKEEPEQTPTCW